MSDATQRIDYSARNRSPLWCFLATTDRFVSTWIAMMGGLYLFGIPTSLQGIALAGAGGLIWAAAGLLFGDAYWGWPGLLTLKRINHV